MQKSAVKGKKMEKTKINYIHNVMHQSISHQEQLAQLVKASAFSDVYQTIVGSNPGVAEKIFKDFFSKFSHKYAFKEG